MWWSSLATDWGPWVSEVVILSFKRVNENIATDWGPWVSVMVTLSYRLGALRKCGIVTLSYRLGALGKCGGHP